ncbi:uncharacterized protein LOC112511668 [Cynara cardunculus var. scolymus]|uniref:Acyl carrier protein n=1 Tax=Cynara cardunculus var. scolymus TaxID=59895 RepID=A0A103XVZ9_CYNCS|nr:uncharacterized protein LOC112511668 [Cynara cardunculus var. scolymus]KVH97904.1 Acyl carrier protein (ACP) [Cynara cardunculus var. scolymus]
MASLSTSATLLLPSRLQSNQFTMAGKSRVIVILKSHSRSSHCFNTKISCSAALPQTLKIVQTTIAKQLSVDENTVAPATKFADLGADSLDTVEIMMALEEQFGVSIGESGAENISTVQDAADLIEKVKAAETTN